MCRLRQRSPVTEELRRRRWFALAARHMLWMPIPKATARATTPRATAVVTCGAVLYGAFIAPNGETAQAVGFVIAFVARGVGLLTALVGAASTRPPRHRWMASALLNLRERVPARQFLSRFAGDLSPHLQYAGTRSRSPFRCPRRKTADCGKRPP